MAYAALSDLLLRVTSAELVALTDDTRSGQVATDTVAGALTEASAMIDSYCRDRYGTPLQPSGTATRICRDITLYLLYSRRPQKMSDTVRQRYEDAVAVLKDISAGKASLDQPAGSTTAQTPSAGAVLPRHTGLRFTERDIEGFV